MSESLEPPDRDSDKPHPSVSLYEYPAELASPQGHLAGLAPVP